MWKITEVKPKNFRYQLTLAEIAVEGYDTFGSNLQNNIGRGICLYIHKSLKANPVDLKTDFQESTWATIKLVEGDVLLVGCIYRSSSGSDINNDKLLEIITEASNFNYSHLLIMGDFNFEKINWDTWSTPSQEASIDYRFIECARDNFLYQHIRKPTRGRIDQEPHILDLVFTNEDGMVSDLNYLSPLGKSDHSVIVFKFNCYTQQDNTGRVKYYYDRANFTGMKRDLLEIDWQAALDSTDINTHWNTLKTVLLDIQDKYVPKRNCRTSDVRKGKVSLDSKTLSVIRKKHRCWKRYMETKDSKKYKDYCKVRNQVKKLTRNAVKSKEKEIINEIKTNPKKFWQYTRSKTKTRTGIADLKVDNSSDKLTNNYAEKADVLSKIFSSVFTLEDCEDIPILDERPLVHKMTRIEISEETVRKLLSDLDISKSPGPDKLHPRILHDLCNEIAKPITTIFSRSLRTMDIPGEWRDGWITAIFKKGTRKLPSTYRPVSLTCILSKVLEKLLGATLLTI